MDKPFKPYVPKKRTAVLPPSEPIVELPKIMMIRHLERIDYSDNPSSKEYKEWLTKKTNYNYLINPYLDNENSAKRLIDNLYGKHIDHIICSPFVRCIQTAIMVTNSDELDISDKTIHIDYRLGELIHREFSFNVPLNSEEVFEHSKIYIDENFNTYRYELDTSNNLPLVFEDYESDEAYDKRILDELKNIRSKYSGNLLIVTHADAYKQFNEGRKGMNYATIYNINLELTGDSYKEKYIKYKTKYLELKAKFKK